jgi:uncharacterized membrane protein YhaH (DUF805 family)
MADNAVLCVACGYHLERGGHLASAARYAALDADNPYRAPQAEPSSFERNASAWDMLRSLLSIEGRAPRSHWWIVNGGGFLIFLILGSLMERKIIPEAAGVIGVGLLLWPLMATQIRRWHDMDKSGFWCFINWLPIIGPIWALIELGLQRGTEGPNGYGEDPLQ